MAPAIEPPAFSSIAGAVAFSADSRVRPIAVTGAARSRVYPETPTVAETLPGFDVDGKIKPE